MGRVGLSSQTISRDERLSVIENLLLRSLDGVRVVELANACQVDRRTIYRDIAKLRKNGLPVYQKQGRFYIRRDYYLASVQLSLNETMALFTAVRIMAHVAQQQTPYAVSALAKLCAALPEPLAGYVDMVVRQMRQKPVDRLFVRVVEMITRACLEQRQVRLWHTDDSIPLIFAPYFLEAAADGTIYGVGYDIHLNGVRAICLNTVLRVEILTAMFTPQKVDPTQYLADGSGMVWDQVPRTVEVILAFQKEEVQLILSRGLHDVSRVGEPMEDGRVLVHLKVTKWEDYLPWVRSLGPGVEVLRPEALREAVLAEAAKIVALYEKEKDESP